MPAGPESSCQRGASWMWQDVVAGWGRMREGRREGRMSELELCLARCGAGMTDGRWYDGRALATLLV